MSVGKREMTQPELERRFFSKKVLPEEDTKEEVLVCQNTRDRTFAKVKSFREANIAEAKKEKKEKKIAEARCRVIYYFQHLTKKSLRIFENQLSIMTKEELEEIADLLVWRVWPWAILQTAIYVAFPIVGWLLPILGQREDFKSLWYLYYRHILKKNYGKGYFPYRNMVNGVVWEPAEHECMP